MLDEDYGDITDPTDGRDVKVVCVKAPGRMWATTTVRPRGKPSSLSNDSSQAKQWLDDIPNLDELYSLKTYEELEKTVNDWLDGDETQEDSSDSRTPSSHSSDEVLSTETTTKYKNLDEAFADLEDL